MTLKSEYCYGSFKIIANGAIRQTYNTSSYQCAIVSRPIALHVPCTIFEKFDLEENCDLEIRLGVTHPSILYLINTVIAEIYRSSTILSK